VTRSELEAALRELDDDARDVGAVAAVALAYALRRWRGRRHSGENAADATP
jgi:uncharacterized protein YbjQ (UPF0145 family)